MMLIDRWPPPTADTSHHISRAVALNGAVTEREALSALADAFDRGVCGTSTVATGRVEGRIKH